MKLMHRIFTSKFFVEHPHWSKVLQFLLYWKWLQWCLAKLMLYKLRKSIEWSQRFHDLKWYNRPDLFTELSDVGDLYMRWFFDAYCGMRLIKNMPIFDKAYKLMEERGNLSRKTAFGEMPGDNYLWIEKCDHSKVIVSESQSSLTVYIKDNLWDEYPNDKIFQKFHMRALAYRWNYPRHRKLELSKLTLKRYRDANFKREKTDFVGDADGLYFGDARDKGYMGSMDFGQINHADGWCLSAIDSMSYWENYVDHPDELS